MQDVYRKIQQEYENNRNTALAEVERKKQDIYEKEPKVLDIDESIKKIGMEITKSIIFIDDDKRYMYDLRHEIRFVDASEYPSGYKCSAHEFLGFLCGMLSSNYDLSLIAVDAFKKLVNTEMSELENLFDHLNKLSEQRHVNIVLSVSADAEELPEFITRLAI